MKETTLRKELPSELLNAENLPSMPTVAVEVLQLTQDENTTIDELSRVLGRDPALSAKLLKLSNSSLFSTGSPVTTLQRATMVLGLKTVKLMSLSFSLVGKVPREGHGIGFELGEFWRRSIVNAVTSRMLGERVHPPIGDEAFLCGLLGHMGRLVLAQVFSPHYEPVLREHGTWPSCEDEQRMLGFDSRDVARALFESWHLPPEVHEPLFHRGDPDAVAAGALPRTRELARVLSMALLAEEVLCGTNARAALDRLGTMAGAAFGFTNQTLDEFLVRLESSVQETADMLNVPLPPDLSYQDIVDQARQRIVNVSLGLDVELRQANRRSEELEGSNRELRTAANTDALTGLANRKSLDEFIAGQVRDRMHGSVPRALGVLLIDLDRFKSLNDTYGHAAGDEVLRLVGSVLSRATRRGDLAARYGGEEFAVVLPQTTPFSLRAAADRLRKEIEKASVSFDGHELAITASLGGVCACDLEHEDDGKRLLKLADHFLYKAKENGRNRCEAPKQIVKLRRR